MVDEVLRERNRQAVKRYKLRHPERIKANRRVNQRRSALKHFFNMTEEQYHVMLEQQKGACFICDHVPNGTDTYRSGKNLAIDHDHTCCSGSRSCGKCIRALLCDKCNRGIGHFDDNAKLLQKAVDYVVTFERANVIELVKKATNPSLW